VDNNLSREILLDIRNESSCEHHLGVWSNSSFLWLDVQFFIIALNVEDGSASHLILDMKSLILGSKSYWDVSKVKEFFDESALSFIDDTLALDINTVTIFNLENE
jgi:hypothetical protein